MKSLEPDVEEQALLAGISMFSPFLRNVRDHDDIHLLSKIQVSRSTVDQQTTKSERSSKVGKIGRFIGTKMVRQLLGHHIQLMTVYFGWRGCPISPCTVYLDENDHPIWLNTVHFHRFAPFRNFNSNKSLYFQYTLTKMLEKKLRRNPSRMIHFANFMLGISKFHKKSRIVPSHRRGP